MGKPRRKQSYTPELLENLRYRYEETEESIVDMARSIARSHTVLRALAQEHGWTRFKPPPLDITPAARLAEEVGRLAAEAGRLDLLRHPEERAEGAPRRISESEVLRGPTLTRRAPQDDGEASRTPTAQGDGEGGDAPSEAVDTTSPSTPDPYPPLAVLPGDGVQNETPTRTASPSDFPLSEGGEDGELSREARKARLSKLARGIDCQLAVLRRRQELPLREHEQKDINAAIANLMAGVSRLEQQLQDLDRGHNARSAIDDDGFPQDIDDVRDELARRIEALVAEWLAEEADERGAGDRGDAGA